jgi:shikimate kinase
MVAGTRVYLVGLMGSGKTTVGRRLAALLNCPYYDNDELLVEGSGETLVTLADAGGDRLHEGESAHARHLTVLPPPFVAGIAASVGDRPDVMTLLQATGTIVYLRAHPEVIARRIGTGEGRPWFDGNVLPVLEEMFANRDGAFAHAAHITVDCDEGTPDSIVASIVARAAP